jgi:hypothetical protein
LTAALASPAFAAVTPAKGGVKTPERIRSAPAVVEKACGFQLFAKH